MNGASKNDFHLLLIEKVKILWKTNACTIIYFKIISGCDYFTEIKGWKIGSKLEIVQKLSCKRKWFMVKTWGAMKTGKT